MGSNTDTVITSYGDIENEIQKSRELIDKFIEGAGNLKAQKDLLLDTYQGGAAASFSDAIDTISSDQQTQQENIGADIETKLRNWLDEVSSSENSVEQNIYNKLT